MSLDISKTIVAKSDQLNADDLLAGPITIEVVDVKINNSDQPLEIHYKGDNGKPYKPGKSMRRVLSFMWGSDGEKYIGRSMTLYRDPEIRFGGDVVGGIRISHMSHISSVITIPLTVTRGKRKAFAVAPLAAKAETTPEQRVEAAQKKAASIIARIAECATVEAVNLVCESEAAVIDRLEQAYPDLAERIISQRDFKIESLSTTGE